MNITLEGKVAVVTGAKQGIGKSIAIALAEAGAKVVVSDLAQEDCEEVAKQIGGVGISCDVSKQSEVKELFSKTVSEFGGLDILVNNAGVYPFNSFTEMTEEDWDKVMDINVKGVFLCTKEAVKVINMGGRVINISSIASFIGFEGLTHYCASKGALNSMIRPLALELAGRGITVNGVAPGAIKTPGTADMDSGELIPLIPLKRMGEPEEIANMVTFLASDLANYITGQTIIIDGGWTLK